MADTEDTKVGGKFVESLKRNNKQIRDDRATTISEDAQMRYKREVEDLAMEIKRLKRDQENMLDLSPENAISLKLATDFDAVNYVDSDIALGLKIRNAEIKHEIALKRYEYLFGGL